jgi:hypothetical protein
LATKISVKVYTNASKSVDDGLQDVIEALEFVSDSWLRREIYDKQIRGGMQPVLKLKVESTLQSRSWLGKREILPRNLKGDTGALYYDRYKKLDSGPVAFTWGFHHHQAIMRNILKPIFHKLDKTRYLDIPRLHVIVSPNNQVREHLRMNGASANSENFASYLELLKPELPVPTALISIEQISD